MRIHIYERATKLTDVCGRVDYATNPNRQENLLGTASTVDDPDYWKKLAHDCQAAFLATGGKRKVRNKNGEMVADQCCEARELVIDLPNDAMKREDLPKLAREIAEDFKKRTGAECVVGIHLNHTENNLHIHLIFSERELLASPEIRIATRNVFIDEEGRRRRVKKEIMNTDGQLRPGCRIIPKGEVLSERYFGEKNPMFKDKGWLYNHKHEMADWINRRLTPDKKREVFDKFGPYLAQRKIGKAIYSEDPAIRSVAENNLEWNRHVKVFNNLVKNGHIREDEAREIKTQIALAPDQLQELKAIFAEVYCAIGNLTTDQQQEYAKIANMAGRSVRTKADPEAEQKRKLRDAYHKSRIAWNKVRISQGVDRIVALDTASEISREIRRIERELGYDRPKTTAERRKAVWDAYAAIQEETARNEKLQDYKKQVAKNKADAYDRYRRAIMEYRALKKLHAPKMDRDIALEDLKKARSDYNDARTEARMLNQSYQLLQQYRSFALKLAADPTVSQLDADRALEKYRAAARRLQDPTPEKVRELRKHFTDLQKSQQIRNEKAKVKQVEQER